MLRAKVGKGRVIRWRWRTACALVTLGFLAAPPAARADSEADQREALALAREGFRLHDDVKDYPGALALFRSAQARHPRAKYLLAIAGTLRDMGKDVDAANSYQEYLEAPDTNPAQHESIQKILAEVDQRVAALCLTATNPIDVEIQIDDEPWIPAARAKRWRVAPGWHVLHVRRAGFVPGEQSIGLAAGTCREVVITLRALPPAPETPALPSQLPPPEISRVSLTQDSSPEIRTTRSEVAPVRRNQRSVSLGVVVDARGQGALAAASFLARFGDRYEARAGVLLGEDTGGYLGGVVYLTRGRVRPLASAGMPMVFANDARLAVRGAGGLAWDAGRHVSLALELGIERWFFADARMDATQFVPTVGIALRR